MADDWQPGDLALCLKMGPWREIDDLIDAPDGFPKAGCPYRVEDVAIGRDGCCYLSLADVPYRWRASRFRKIRPHTPDAEDAETIALLTGKPAQVPA